MPIIGINDRQKQSRAIDWNEVHRRLEKAQTGLERELQQSPEEKKKILQARARLLAREEDKAGEEESIEVVEFLLAYERYGLESSSVREVYPLKQLTPLPCTPPFVLGIVNVRGQILTVIDLKKFFDLPEKGLTDLDKIIVVRADEMELGILADAVLGMRSIPLPEIQPPLPTLTGIRAEYLRGVTKERLIVLDTGKLMSDKTLIVCEEVGG